MLSGTMRFFPDFSTLCRVSLSSSSDRAVLGEPQLLPELPDTAARGVSPVLSITTQSCDSCVASPWHVLGCPGVSGMLRHPWTDPAGRRDALGAGSSIPASGLGLAAPPEEGMSPIKLTNSEP